MGKFLGCVGIAIMGFVAGHIYVDRVFEKLNELADDNKVNKESKDEADEND